MTVLKAVLMLLMFLFISPEGGMAFQAYEKDTLPAYIEPESGRDKDIEGGEAHALMLLIRDMATELFANLDDPDPQIGDLADGLLISTFVDINKLYRTSSFGRYLAGQLMNEFQRYSYLVKDMRKSTSVMVEEKRGEFGLSRDVDEIAGNHKARAMLTGTYLVGESEIIVNARILDNENAALLSSATVIFPRNNLGNMMLQDTASARKQQADNVVYMKKLEL
jgi:TolB-like protein